MRKYLYADRSNFGFVLGNGTREFHGWPLPLTISSYGWIADPNKHNIREGWVDTNIEIGPFEFAWQWSITKFGIRLMTHYEIRRRYDMGVN